MDYLEDIKYKDTAELTLEEAKKEILTDEEFAESKVAEEEIQVQASEMVAIPVGTMDEVQAVVVSENVDTESVEMEEAVSEVVAEVPEVLDYSKLTIKERAALLPIPTDDYTAGYDAYCQRRGYTAEKMKSIRYKTTVYEEFLKEYNCRKNLGGIEEMRSMWRNRDKGAR